MLTKLLYKRTRDMFTRTGFIQKGIKSSSTAFAVLLLTTHLLAFMLFVSVLVLEWPIQVRLINVKTDIMGSRIPLGSMAISVAKERYSNGEIVAFTHPQGSSSKVVAIQEYISSVDLQTDPITGSLIDSKIELNSHNKYPLQADEIIGSVYIAIPYVGFVLQWLQSQTGIFISLILPVVVISTHVLRSAFHTGYLRLSRQE